MKHSPKASSDNEKVKEVKEEEKLPIPGSFEDEKELAYEVDFIIDHRDTKEGRSYLLKWVDYPLSESTWGPDHNLGCHLLLRQYLQDISKNVTTVKGQKVNN